MSCKNLLTWAAVAVQLVAAFLWFMSTRVKVSAAEVLAEHRKSHDDGWEPAQIVDDNDGSDYFATDKLRSRWNYWAALATGIGVALQAIALALPGDGHQ